MEEKFEMPVLPRCEDCRFAAGDFVIIDDETRDEEWGVCDCLAKVSNWPEMLEDASECTFFESI